MWKLGDVIHSTPTVVAGPKDRHDAIYGDQSYSAFLQKWYNRRQVAYVGETTACCTRSTRVITIPAMMRVPLLPPIRLNTAGLRLPLLTIPPGLH